MSETAKATFKNKSWDEDRYAERDGDRDLALAQVTQDITGDITGEGSVRWLMAYRPDKTADFTGLQLVDGSLGDRKGSFALKSIGTFDGAVAAGDLEIVEGSGTGDLEGISGKGSFSAPHGPDAEVELTYEIA